MSSQTVEKKIVIFSCDDSDKENSINFNEIIIPFSNFGSSQSPAYIYNGILLGRGIGSPIASLGCIIESRGPKERGNPKDHRILVAIFGCSCCCHHMAGRFLR